MVDMIDYYTNKQLKQQSNSRVLKQISILKTHTISLQSLQIITQTNMKRIWWNHKAFISEKVYETIYSKNTHKIQG